MSVLKGTRKDRIDNRFQLLRIRMREESKWELLPAGICFSIVLLLIGHLLPGLNPRLGNRANIIALESEHEPDGSIWIGLFIRGNEFFIQTSERKIIKVGVEELNQPTIPEFVDYLKMRRNKEMQLIGSSETFLSFRSNVVLAIDQSLKFSHLRPIVNSIAEAGYRRYSFETRILNVGQGQETSAQGASNGGRL